MANKEIPQQVAGILQEVFHRDDIAVAAETSADDIPEWDSINHINVMVAAELQFGIKFEPADAEAVKNVGDLVAIIEKKMAG